MKKSYQAWLQGASVADATAEVEVLKAEAASLLDKHLAKTSDQVSGIYYIIRSTNPLIRCRAIILYVPSGEKGAGIKLGIIGEEARLSQGIQVGREVPTGPEEYCMV